MANIIRRFIVITLPGVLLPGCVLAPKGTREEQSAVREAGRPYTQPFEQRNIPDLPANPTWQDVLHRAFLANGDLEAAYFDWAAAFARIDQAANWPNSNVAPTFSYMFSGGRMKAWDRTTVNVGFDPMQNVSFPTKTAKTGRVALENARAAGQRFAARKFALQKQVLQAWLDLALMEEQIRIQRDNTSLLR